MEYKIIFTDDSTAYLTHHGVKGMHWGVRNAETLRKYAGGSGPKPTRRDVKKAIKYNERQTYKKSGGLFGGGEKYAGQESRKVAKAHREALNNDAEYQQLKTNAREAFTRYNNASKLDYEMQDLKTKVHENKNSKGLAKTAASVGAGIAKANADIQRQEYLNASEAKQKHREKVGSTFVSQYQNALVKDLGFKDVERGKALLNEYGLLEKTSRKYARKVKEHYE